MQNQPVVTGTKATGKNLIFCAYAYESEMQGSTNVANGNATKGKELYMKNIVVALGSAKMSNANTAVALVTNIEIDEPYASLLKNNGILIYKEPFDCFNFGSWYRWGLAFYKLCALKKVLAYDYDNYLLIDADTYTFSNIDDLWLQTADYLMLYDLGHRPTVPNCAKFYREAKAFNGVERQMTKYGGEFIAGNKQILTSFVNKAEVIFMQLKESGFQTTGGDEFIVNNAADQMRGQIKNAGGYIQRYWTAIEFNHVCTYHIYDPISILHVPLEKKVGIMLVYKYYVRHNQFPSKECVFWMLNVPHAPMKLTLLLKRLRGRVRVMMAK